MPIICRHPSLKRQLKAWKSLRWGQGSPICVRRPCGGSAIGHSCQTISRSADGMFTISWKKINLLSTLTLRRQNRYRGNCFIRNNRKSSIPFAKWLICLPTVGRIAGLILERKNHDSIKNTWWKTSRQNHSRECVLFLLESYFPAAADVRFVLPSRMSCDISCFRFCVFWIEGIRPKKITPPITNHRKSHRPRVPKVVHYKLSTTHYIFEAGRRYFTLRFRLKNVFFVTLNNLLCSITT